MQHCLFRQVENNVIKMPQHCQRDIGNSPIKAFAGAQVKYGKGLYSTREDSQVGKISIGSKLPEKNDAMVINITLNTHVSSSQKAKSPNVKLIKYHRKATRIMIVKPSKKF